jgi:2,3-bisphosphoglycerate-independent phosphoglycerate mutase
MEMTRPRGQAVLVIADGLGDLPIDGLGGLTPLEAARTPTMDSMAANGRFGLVDPIAPGVIPNTDSAVALLLGLPPKQAGCMKRGPVEAAGAGLALRPGDIAARTNFATLEPRGGRLLVTDRRAGRITAGTAELAAALQDIDLGGGVRAQFLPTDQHRGVLVLSGPGLHPAVSDTDPGDSGVPGYLCDCRPLQPEAAQTAAAVNRFVRTAHERLSGHAVNDGRRRAGKALANGVITRGAGTWFGPENVVKERGVNAALVAGCNTVLGLARLFGLDTLEDPAFTATLDTDLDRKVATSIRALRRYDLVFMHVKAPDLCAHDRRPGAKRDFLERLDSAMAPLAEAGVIVALTSDHSTDSNSGSHTADPVPSLIFGPQAVSDPAGAGPKFGESSCRQGNLARQRSHEYLAALMTEIGF